MEASRRQWIIGSLAITGWFVWAFFHLLPPHAVLHGGIFHHYWPWSYEHLAYTDIFALYQNHQLYNHALPYITTPIEYPVLMGILMWIAALAGSPIGYYLVTALFIWVAALFTYRWLVEWAPKVAWAFALTPMLFTFGLLNWDVIGIFLMMLAIRLFDRKRYDGASVVFAAAVFFKLFPIFYLPFIALRLWQQKDRKLLGRMVAIFVGTSLVINLPFALSNWANWSLFFRYNAGRSVSTDIWNNVWIQISSVPVVDAISLMMVLLTLLFTARYVWRGGSLYHAAALLFAIFLLVNKVFSPQYMLWLLAFGAIAEWPLWTMGLLSVGGVTDYVNSMAILHLYNAESRSANWYADTIYPLGLLLRYLAVVISPIGAMAMRRQTKKSHGADRGALERRGAQAP